MEKTGTKRNKAELACCRALRLVWYRSPPYWEAMRRVKIESNQYRCEGCKGIFKLREVQVDHIEPVVSVKTGWRGLAEFAFRLFCPASGLQVLCEDKCHLAKSTNENKDRKKS